MSPHGAIASAPTYPHFMDLMISLVDMAAEQIDKPFLGWPRQVGSDLQAVLRYWGS